MAPGEVRRPANYQTSYQARSFQQIRTPLIESLRAKEANCTNPQVHFVAVSGVDHFGVLAPANEAIAAKIRADVGPRSGITLSERELKGDGR